jgi:hypothetical protein
MDGVILVLWFIFGILTLLTLMTILTECVVISQMTEKEKPITDDTLRSMYC